MHWGPTNHHYPDYESELAAFVTTHSGIGPAILWPDHIPPPALELAAHQVRLARDLSGLLARSVTPLPAEHLASPIAHLGDDHDDLLLLQRLSSSDIEVSGLFGSAHPVTSGGTTRLRLLQGEALYLPSGRTAVLRHEPGTRHILLRIGN